MSNKIATCMSMDPFIRAVFFNTVYQNNVVANVSSSVPNLFMYLNEGLKSYISDDGYTYSLLDGFAVGIWATIHISGNDFNIRRGLVIRLSTLVTHNLDETVTYELGKNMFPVSSITKYGLVGDEKKRSVIYEYDWDDKYNLPTKVSMITIDVFTGEVIDVKDIEYAVIENEEEVCYDNLSDGYTLIKYKK